MEARAPNEPLALAPAALEIARENTRRTTTLRLELRELSLMSRLMCRLSSVAYVLEPDTLGRTKGITSGTAPPCGALLGVTSHLGGRSGKWKLQVSVPTPPTGVVKSDEPTRYDPPVPSLCSVG